MTGLQSSDTLDALREKIARLENRPVLAASVGLGSDRAEGLLNAPAGLLHEVFTSEQRNTGAALGFALGQARGLISAARPALIHLQLGKEAGDLGVPYGAGIAHFGIDPDALVLCRVETVTELLWAIEEAAGCRAVAAIAADIWHAPKALDFTASRRLSLRASAAGSSIFLIRYGRAREASAAHLRWRIEPEPSATPRFDDRAPGHARFRAILEKGRGTREATDLLIDWTDHGFVVVEPAGTQPAAGAAPSGAAPAALGHRLSQTG